MTRTLVNKLTDEEKTEARDYALNLIKLPYEEVKNLARTSRTHILLFTRFFRLAKDELHEAIKEKFLEPEWKERAEKLEIEILDLMKENRLKFMYDYWIDQLEHWEVKYHIISHILTSHKFWNDEILVIWIPYYSTHAQCDKFWYKLEIKKSEVPQLFKKFICEMKRYQWNAFLTSTKR